MRRSLFRPGQCRRCLGPVGDSPDSWYCRDCLPLVEAERQAARQDEAYLIRYVSERWGFQDKPTWSPKRADSRRDYGPSDWEIAYQAPVERPGPSPAERILGGGLYLALLERCEDGDEEAQKLERGRNPLGSGLGVSPAPAVYGKNLRLRANAATCAGGRGRNYSSFSNDCRRLGPERTANS